MATGEPDLSSSSSAPAAVPDAAPTAAKKDRHIVSWSAEEDAVLRSQIAIHGTDNWTIIAAQFQDKTARQCRRRWYNYLNSECKKGGWSQEEDMLLCEAQKVFGNRWTEIAKVVSGRTDNAVKNRFSTLCKRRAKDDDSNSENGTPCSNTNAKRVVIQIGCPTPGAAESSLPLKPISSDLKENIVPNMRLFGQEKSTQGSRQPLAIIPSSNKENVKIVESQNLATKTAAKQLIGVKREGSFLNKDDPKVATLLQQADLLSSLAVKINAENTSQSMDEAWQQLQQHLVKKDDSEMPESSMSGMASLLDDLDDLIVDPYENNEEDKQKQREEQNGPIDEHNEPCNASSQASKEVLSFTASDEKMDDCPVDLIKENNSLSTNMLSGNVDPCPGTEIQASENLREVAEDSMLQFMESTPPVVTDFDDLIVDPYESKEEYEQNSREQSEQIDVHDEHSNGPQTSMVLTSDMAHVLKMDDCPVDNCREDNSICISMLPRTMECCPGADNPATENSCKVSEGSMLKNVESASPVQTNFQSKECAEIPVPVNHSDVAEGRRLQGVEFASPTHTVFHTKAGAFVSPKCGEVGKDSKLPSVEFTSPAHTVQTFQPYEADMPTPKFTASERNFLLSVLDLASPGSKPETSQQPSCKRALLNSL